MFLDYKSDYSEVSYLKEDDLLIVTWNDYTWDMSFESFKKELLFKIELVKKFRPSTHLVDSRYFSYSIIPEEQEWISQHIFPEYAKNGVKKLAFIICADKVSQMSIEQSIQEDQTGQFSVRYFSNLPAARDWLRPKPSFSTI
ncbi:MAG: hypothetical protein AAFU64_01015 [Bacteroidota bacterium]